MVLITDPGSASADSYATVEQADDRLISTGRFSWDHMSTEEKETQLRRATVWIDQIYWQRFPGQRSNGRDQSLEWPRKYVMDSYGNIIADDQVPQEIVIATIEAAMASPDDLIEQPRIRRRREKVGPIEEEYEYSGGHSEATPLTRINQILFPVLTATLGATSWVMRA